MTQQCAENAGITREAAGAASGRAYQGVEIRRRIVGERIPFGVAPHELDRVEFGRVGWEQFDTHPGVGREPALDDLASMRVAAIPDDRDRQADRPQQVAEKGPHPAGVDARIRCEPKETPHAVPARRNHERRDDRHFLPRPTALVEDRCLAAGRPGAAHERRDQDAGLINEDQRGLAARGVFFTTGQRSFTHWAIAASSRSIARRVGCCGLQPNA